MNLEHLKKMPQGVCEECGETGAISQEHLIPQWFSRKLFCFGMSYTAVLKQARLLNEKMIYWTCPKCNSSKGSMFIYSDARVEKFLRGFVELINEHLDRARAPRHVLVICKCVECQTTFNKVVSNPNAISSVEAHRTALATHNGNKLPPGLEIPKEPHELMKTA